LLFLDELVFDSPEQEVVKVIVKHLLFLSEELEVMEGSFQVRNLFLRPDFLAEDVDDELKNGW
jgi:hypothetical protein